MSTATCRRAASQAGGAGRQDVCQWSRSQPRKAQSRVDSDCLKAVHAGRQGLYSYRGTRRVTMGWILIQARSKRSRPPRNPLRPKRAATEARPVRLDVAPFDRSGRAGMWRLEDREGADPGITVLGHSARRSRPAWRSGNAERWRFRASFHRRRISSALLLTRHQSNRQPASCQRRLHLNPATTSPCSPAPRVAPHGLRRS